MVPMIARYSLAVANQQSVYIHVCSKEVKSIDRIGEKLSVRKRGKVI